MTDLLVAAPEIEIGTDSAAKPDALLRSEVRYGLAHLGEGGVVKRLVEDVFFVERHLAARLVCE